MELMLHDTKHAQHHFFNAEGLGIPDYAGWFMHEDK